MSMVRDMSDFGKMMYNMEKEKRLGQMGLIMKEIITLERKQDQVPIHGQMEANLQANGKKIE